MELSALLATQIVLPSIPKVVALLLNELDNAQPDLKKISQLISTDPALTTRLLQLSNSGFFKLSRQVNSVSEALAILGLRHVRAMAAAAATSTSFKTVPGINLQQFWAYSLTVAKLSRSLAGVVRQNQQAAFTAGLIHFIGELAMRIAMPQDMAALVKRASKPRGIVPVWAGSKMPLSSEMADSVQALLDAAADGDFSGPEMQAATPMLAAQARLAQTIGGGAAQADILAAENALADAQERVSALEDEVSAP